MTTLIDVPGIGKVKIAGEAPDQQEEMRIRGELAKRGFRDSSSEAIRELERRTGTSFNVSPAPTDIPPAEGAVPPAEGEVPDIQAPPSGERQDLRLPPSPQDQTGRQFAQMDQEADAMVPGVRKAAEEVAPVTDAGAVARVAGETGRMGADAVGAVVGASRGAQAGRIIGGPLGSVAGAIVGGAIGYATVNTTRKAAEDFIKSGNLPTAGKTVERYGQAIKEDLIGQGVVAGGIGVIRGAANVGLRMFGTMLGVASPTVQEAIRSASRMGVDIGASDFNSPVARAIAKTLLVIPVIATPVRREAAIKTAQVAKAAQNVLDDISPPVNINALSGSINSEATRLWRARRDVYEGMKDGLAARVEEAGNPRVIDGDILRLRMLEFLNRFRANSAELPAHMRGDPNLGFTGSQQLDDYINKLIPPQSSLMTFKEANAAITDLRLMFQKYGTANGVMSDINKTISSGMDNAWKTGVHESLVAWRDALTRGNQAIPAQGNRRAYELYLEAYNTIRAQGRWTTPTQMARFADDIVNQSTALRQEWANIKALETSVAAGVLSKSDRNMFRAGYEKTGTVEADALSNAVTANPHLMQSPEFIKNLTSLMGPENVRAVARQYLTRTLFGSGNEMLALNKLTGAPGTSGMARRGMLAPSGQGAETIPILDPKNAKLTLGLSDSSPDKGKQSEAALALLLQGTRTTPKMLKDFLDVAERIQSGPTGDASSFLARRLVLGGFGSIGIGAAAAAGAGSTGIGLGMMGLAFTARSMGNLITTPKGLKLLTQGMDDLSKTRDVTNFLRRMNVALNPEDRVVSVETAEGQWKRLPITDLEKLMRDADKEAEDYIKRLERAK